MYDEYGMTEEMVEEMDDQMFWQQVEVEEQRRYFDEARDRQEEDWQAILDNDPDYHKWADALEREAAFERDLAELAQMENERKFNTLQPWD